MATLQQIIEDAGFDCRSYSGRGMYGKNCLGVVIGEFNQFLSGIFDSVARSEDPQATADILSNAFRSMRQDSMGYDIIVYFPYEEYSEEFEDSEEDEEIDEE